MKLKADPCPCGCRKLIVRPLFGNVEASLYREEADELVRRWNAFEIEDTQTPHLLAAEINALPQRVRDYIHHLETDADPAGDKWRLAAAEENLAALSVHLARIGAKGGKKKGATKKRGSANYYREMARTRWEKPK